MTDQQPADPNAQQPQQPQQPQPAAPSPLSQSEDIQWASFAHLGGILGFLPSLIIWLIFKDRGPFTNTEAKEALNFQITMVGASIALWILTTILITISWGLLSPLALFNYAPWVVSVIFSIIAFTKVKDGNHYRYPFAIRLIK
ncbi:DUF4870 domain-containing protein [Agromyces mangrovi Wang et al. 2018]|uniref:DUF4870 domain-containing protein n=1 Tax=Agromyces mangrovi TaxID=1858653 RepID=UPI0025748D67|nr:DUF4870 domain-containing protein [Agromyces mangrovi]